MRIGIDARFYGTLGKGLGRYTEKLLSGLEKIESGDEYFIFLRRENFDEYIPANPRFRKVIADFPWYSLSEQILFPRLLRKYELDLVHFPHFNVPWLYRAPFVVTIHDLILLHFPTVKASELPPLLYWVKYLAYRFIIASAIQRARKVLTVSEFTKKDIQEKYPRARRKIMVTLEAADDICAFVSRSEKQNLLGKLHLLKESENDILRPYSLYVGNAYPHKNLSLILDLAAAFPQELFVLVGKEDYFYRELKNSVKDRSLSNVFFAGYVSDRHLDILYQSARLYLFPSLYEGFGLPALEACARGLPVLAANRGSLPEILGEAALFFEPDDKKTFFTLFRTGLQDEVVRNRLKQAGYRRQREFSWERLALLTQASYSQVLQ